MKFLMSLVFLLSLTTAFSQSEKAKATKPKKEGKITLKPLIDYNPKLLSLMVPNINKKSNFPVVIEIENTSDEDKMVKVIFYEYNPDEYGINDLEKSKANIKRAEFSINDYIKYNRNAFMVKAKQKMKYKLEVDLPKDLKGTKYALYTVQEVPFENFVEAAKAKQGRGSSIAMSVGYMSPLVVDVDNSGEKKVDLTLKYFPKTNVVLVDAKNAGDHYLRVPNVNAVILNEKNEFVQKLTLQLATNVIKNLHPYCHLPFVERMSRGLKPGKYRVIMALTADEGLFVHNEEQELIVEAPPAKPAKKGAKSK